MLLEIAGVSLTQKGDWKLTGKDGKTYYAKKEFPAELGKGIEVIVNHSTYKNKNGEEVTSKWVSLASTASPKKETPPPPQLPGKPAGEDLTALLAIRERGLATLCSCILLQASNPSLAVIKSTAKDLAEFIGGEDDKAD